MFYKLVYKSKNFFHKFYNIKPPLDRKSCEDHESTHFCVSKTLSFWFIAFSNSIFLDLNFFLEKIQILLFLGKLSFKMFVFWKGIQWTKLHLSESCLAFKSTFSPHFFDKAGQERVIKNFPERVPFWGTRVLLKNQNEFHF